MVIAVDIEGAIFCGASLVLIIVVPLVEHAIRNDFGDVWFQ